MELNILDLGLCEYSKALTIQMETLEAVREGLLPDTLILVEHPAIITMGRHAKAENLLVSKERLEKMGIDLQQVNRGGDITYHGPGQLVGYPIFNLKARHGGSIRQFVHRLESVFIDLLQETWAVESQRDPCNAGVWVGNDKLVAIGLAVKHGVTMHGFSFNVAPNLSHYGALIPCGLVGRGVTTLERLTGTRIPMEMVKPLVIRSFMKHYGFE